MYVPGTEIWNNYLCSSLVKIISPTLSIPQLPVILCIGLCPCGLFLFSLACLVRTFLSVRVWAVKLMRVYQCTSDISQRTRSLLSLGYITPCFVCDLFLILDSQYFKIVSLTRSGGNTYLCVQNKCLEYIERKYSALIKWWFFTMIHEFTSPGYFSRFLVTGIIALLLNGS